MSEAPARAALVALLATYLDVGKPYPGASLAMPIRERSTAYLEALAKLLAADRAALAADPDEADAERRSRRDSAIAWVAPADRDAAAARFDRDEEFRARRSAPVQRASVYRKG